MLSISPSSADPHAHRTAACERTAGAQGWQGSLIKQRLSISHHRWVEAFDICPAAGDRPHPAGVRPVDVQRTAVAVAVAFDHCPSGSGHVAASGFQSCQTRLSEPAQTAAAFISLPAVVHQVENQAEYSPLQSL